MFQVTLKEGVGSHNTHTPGDIFIVTAQELKAFGDKFENVEPVEIEYDLPPSDNEIEEADQLPIDIPDLSDMSTNDILKAVDAGEIDAAYALEWLQKNRPRSKTAQKALKAKL